MSEALGTIAVMPRISEFYGIVIEMFFRDHPPPGCACGFRTVL
jgi:hypothetical protein